jgi:hypothetical protein
MVPEPLAAYTVTDGDDPRAVSVPPKVDYSDVAKAEAPVAEGAVAAPDECAAVDPYVMVQVLPAVSVSPVTLIVPDDTDKLPEPQLVMVV